MRLTQPTRTVSRKQPSRVSPRTAPIRSCSRWGLPCRSCCQSRGGLLPHPFTLTTTDRGGLLSVALSLGSPPPGVTRHRISVEPGLSSPKGHPLRAVIRPSGGAELRDCQGALQQDCNEISKFEDEPCLVEACLNNLLTKRYLVVVQQASQTPDRLTAARSTRMKTESSPYPTRSGMKCRWKAVAATRVCGLSTPVGSTS
jgi:hypothetical protein